MYQDTRNGPPSSWGHAPFTGVFYDAQYDNKIGGSGQSMAMLMARYPITSNIEVGAGARHNRWSGAYAVCIDFIDGQCRYNNFFNVDFFGKDARGVESPGYTQTTNDFTAGIRWVNGPWSASTGLVYLSKAKTDNPSERGQSNSLLKGSIGGGYNFGNGLVAFGSVSAFSYGQKPQSWGCNILKDRPANSCTLGPRSAPINNPGASDARVSSNSMGASAGLDYSF
jgi:predicted porin